MLQLTSYLNVYVLYIQITTHVNIVIRQMKAVQSISISISIYFFSVRLCCCCCSISWFMRVTLPSSKLMFEHNSMKRYHENTRRTTTTVAHIQRKISDEKNANHQTRTIYEKRLHIYTQSTSLASSLSLLILYVYKLTCNTFIVS